MAHLLLNRRNDEQRMDKSRIRFETLDDTIRCAWLPPPHLQSRQLPRTRPDESCVCKLCERNGCDRYHVMTCKQITVSPAKFYVITKHLHIVRNYSYYNLFILCCSHNRLRIQYTMVTCRLRCN